MKKYYKLFIILLIVFFIVPQITLAVWWNPFTWKIFSIFSRSSQPSEIEKLRSEVDALKKQIPSATVDDKSKTATKSVTPVVKVPVSASQLKKQDPQQFKALVSENKTQLAEASKLLSNKNIIARVKPSVVYIETATGSGSGVIVGADGYVLTNAHVVSGANSATVKLSNGGSFNGVVVGRDENIDLALLKINATGLSAAFLGDSDLVEQGDPVFTFGYPLGIEGDVAFKDGTLSRRQKIDGTTYLEISAQILPGNSGGPLANQSGEVIGINTLAVGTLKISGVLIGETLKFALPINLAKGLIPDLKSGRNVLLPKTISPALPPLPAPTPNPTPTCTPSWQCGDWTTCTNSQQTRSCWDSKGCGVTTGKPSEMQSCVPPCSPDWQCGSWGTCTNSQQTRICTDSNKCGVITGKPSEKQSCTVKNIYIHFDTNDAWNTGNANDKCGLDLTENSTPDGGIPTYSSTQNDWPLSPKPVFSWFMLNVGNNAPLTGVSLKSVKVTNIGTADLEKIGLEATIGSGAAAENNKLKTANLTSNAAEFLADPKLVWPFQVNFVFNPNGMVLGETLGLVITEITLVSDDDRDVIKFIDTFPVLNESPKMAIKCERK